MKYKKILIIISTYNEEKFIGITINKVLQSNTRGLIKEIIIFNNGSKDKTKNIIQKISKSNKNIITIGKKINKGNKGREAALKNGFLKSSGDIVLIQDADLEYDPNDYPFLIEPFIKYDADVVYGSRFISIQPHRILFFWHYLDNIFLTILSNIFTNFNFTDIETGYKVFKGGIIRKLAKNLNQTDLVLNQK